ncbi:hypothetical protein PhaeoP57_00183 [Phaeobacter inhibens]|nr:hypothetical protein PhaeoP57_00183 [Phaeobacter inhibens]
MLERLYKAQDYVARCIAAGDESLLPLFERLEREITKLKQEENALQRARRMAKISAGKIIPFSSQSRSSSVALGDAQASSHRRNTHAHEFA